MLVSPVAWLNPRIELGLIDPIPSKLPCRGVQPEWQRVNRSTGFYGLMGMISPCFMLTGQKEGQVAPDEARHSLRTSRTISLQHDTAVSTSINRQSAPQRRGCLLLAAASNINAGILSMLADFCYQILRVPANFLTRKQTFH